MSRHRRQPSRALPLDFNVVVDDDGQPPPTTLKGATSLEGSQNAAPSGNHGGDRGDAGGADKVHKAGLTKKPPPATGGRTLPEGNGSTGAR